MGYRWKKNHKGQYVDGHERADVVHYQQNVFLPAMEQYEHRMQTWVNEHGWDLPCGITQAIIIWVHDESIFYAHDRHQTAWYHKDATAKPYMKGEGVSLMVANFVSADHGWLRSPDGKKAAHVIFHPGKNREGYFTNEDILAQAQKAMAILSEHYPHEDHVFSTITHQLTSHDVLMHFLL